MRQFRIHTEADSRSNRRSRNWTIEADNTFDAVEDARVRHSILVRGNHSVWATSVVEIVDGREVELTYVKGEWTRPAETETCTGCGQPLTPNALPEALRTTGARQCETCDLFALL